MSARKVAAEAVRRIESEGAYANVVLPAMLAQSDLDARDRAFVTSLVYGATRMRRTCHWLVDRFVAGDLDPTARSLLTIGAYQLAFLDTPPHAAVSATVDAAPRRLRGLVNAVLRKVATAPREWPDEGTRLSYPDWLIDALGADLGRERAIGALEAMNRAASPRARDDGYVQDEASEWVADAVGAGPGERVADLCAAPGGKATRLATSGAWVVAADRRWSRLGLVRANVDRLGLAARTAIVAADAALPPFRAGSFDRVLVDAPCTGLGALARRPDARWRAGPGDAERLGALQEALLDAAVALLRPGGLLVYSVCTLSRRETSSVDDHVRRAHPSLVAAPAIGAPPGTGWEPLGRGHLLLPQAAGTDGMFLLRLRLG